MKLKWAAKPPAFDRIKSFDHLTSLQNIAILGAQGLLMLMGSKFLIKMTRPQNIKMKEQRFAAWSSVSKILIPSTSGDLEHPNKQCFCSEVMMIKSFNPIKTRRPCLPILISLLQQDLLVLGCSFHLECFCLDFTSLLKMT